MRSDNMSAENRLLIAALKIFQSLAYGPTALFQVKHYSTF